MRVYASLPSSNVQLVSHLGLFVLVYRSRNTDHRDVVQRRKQREYVRYLSSNDPTCQRVDGLLND